MNIVLYDEHPAMLDSIKQYFNGKNAFQTVSSFNCKYEVINYIKKNKVNIVITEYLSEDEIGLSWIYQIKKHSPTSKVILFNGVHSIFDSTLLSDLGVDACINKNKSLDYLYETVIELTSITDHGLKPYNKPKCLTQKEKSIIKFMTQGLTSNEIAEIMQCSTHTINNQKNHLIKKFSCKTSSELIAKLFRMGYLKL